MRASLKRSRGKNFKALGSLHAVIVDLIKRCYSCAAVLADFSTGDPSLKMVNECAGNSWLKLLPPTSIVVVTGRTLVGFSRELLSLLWSDLRTVILASGEMRVPPATLTVALIDSAPALMAFITRSPLGSLP